MLIDQANGNSNGNAAGGPRGLHTILLTGELQGQPEFVEGVLGEEPYRLLYAQNPVEAVANLNARMIDLIILSNQQPASPGLDFCRSIKGSRKTELIPVLMITGNDTRSQIDALGAGADDFLNLPAHPELARTQVRALVRKKAITDRLEPAEDILFALAQAIERRDQTTGNHCERLSLYSLALGIAAGLGDDDLQALYRGGYLHDIGKVALPDKVLNKPGPLDEEEWKSMRSHTLLGEEICRPLGSLHKVLPIIRHHHERWDGSGYPDGLQGNRIPLLARVLQLGDIYDALIHMRPYKPALAPETALQIMQQETARGWRDPELMGLFVEVHRGTKNTETWRDAEDMRRSLQNLRNHLRGDLEPEINTDKP